MPFTLEHRDGVAFLRDAHDQPFFSLGVNHIDDPALDPEVTGARLTQWGFNSLGYSGHPVLRRRWPFLGRAVQGQHHQFRRPDRFAYSDVFDPDFRAKLKAGVAKECAAHREDPNLIGLLWMDLPQWGLDLARAQKGIDWVTFHRQLPPAAAGRQAYHGFLRERYGEVARLNQVYGTAFAAWEDCAGAEWSALGIAAEVTAADDEAFLVRIARQYYGDIGEALRTHGPDLLCFGETYWSSDLPEGVLQAAAQYLDVVSVQFGPAQSPYPGDGYELNFDADCFRRLHALTGKPVFIADHAVSFPDDEHPRTLWHQAASQEAAGEAYRAFVLQAAQTPYVVGYGRCQYLSAYTPWRDTLKQGLLDKHGSPYATYCTHVAQANRAALAAFEQRVTAPASAVGGGGVQKG